MKKFIFIAGLLLVLINSLSSQDFYDINTINTIEISFTQSNWDYLLDNLMSADEEGRLLGSVTINGIYFDSVGVRYKGNSSYNAYQVKNPLNIKLDYIIDDQTIEGYGTLKLANVYKDPSFIRETLSYEIARKYFPAGQSNYANVYINGTHLGLYTSDQDVDKYFMRTHFSNSENVRIKGEIDGNVRPDEMGGVWEYYGSDSSSYYHRYVIESDHGWRELVNFLDTLNNHSDCVDQVLNVDRHLWFLAFQNLLVNLDGPINNPQNYYLFEDASGRFNPIPWDLNESFGVFSMLQSSGSLSTTQLTQLSPFVNLNNSDYPVIGKILSNTTYRKMYVAHMKTMLEENFENDLYYDRALEIQQIINADVQADPNKFYSYSNFLSNLTTSTGSSGPPPSSSVIGITELMDARVDYLTGLAEFQCQAPEITIVSTYPEQVSVNGEVSITATVANASQVYLGYRANSTDPFEKISMIDDGNHNDGLSGDGVYGSEIFTLTSDMQYYIYAENDVAASFSPQRAEYEYYTITSTSDVTVNEFLADNESIAADQDGEYDDWIELYNNTDSDISLNGFFLSDDGTDLTQWCFPDTSIPANDYLIVWADNDEEQTDLHANFKLSSSGETLYFLTPDSTIINAVTFGVQAPDSSTGRYPDGVGSFITMDPSFSATNRNTTAGTGTDQLEFPQSFVLQQNYPNPFNPVTNIGYGLPQAGQVVLTIYDLLGREIRTLVNDYQAAGHHQVQWNGTNKNGNSVSSGVYIYAIRSDNYHSVKKMLLVK